MIQLQYVYGCRIKATLLDQFGEPYNLHRCRGIAAVVVNPLGIAWPVPRENIKYNEFRNEVRVAVTPKVLATPGDYLITVTAVAATGGTMVASPLTPFLSVADKAPTRGTADIDMDLTLESVVLPSCAGRTGASPTISPRGTWLVWNDELGGYEETGQQVGYAALASRYDAKFAEILQPAVRATDAANAAAKSATDAATKCGTATDAANDAAKTCAENNEKAEKLISQMESLIDDSTECVFVDTAYDLPAQGNEKKVYIVKETNVVYRYSADDVCYYKIGIGYNDGDEVVFDGNGVSDTANLNVINLSALKTANAGK